MRIPAITVMIFLAIGSFACSSRVVYQREVAAVVKGDAININTATPEELERLPHIGRKTAESIVQFRVVNGPFRRPEHLLQIRGVSETRFLEIKDLIKAE